MEPDLITEERLLPILDELRQREPIFHRPEQGSTRRDFEAMTDEHYWEIGASGRRYSRTFVLDTLDQRAAHPADDPWETRDFYCRELSPDTYLLTYTLLQGPRVTRRTTLWRRAASGWQILFHQGTLLHPAG